MQKVITDGKKLYIDINSSVYDYRWIKYAKVLTFAKGISNTV